MREWGMREWGMREWGIREWGNEKWENDFMSEWVMILREMKINQNSKLGLTSPFAAANSLKGGN